MKTKILLIISSFFIGSVTIRAEKLPNFSWDKVPVCIHLASAQQDFSEKDLKFMSRFPLVCLEKNQAVKKHGYMEKGVEIASKGIKKYNPNTKVLFYWNSRIDYGALYSHGEILKKHPDWAMLNTKGEPIVVHAQKRKTYDPTNEELRKWWVSVPIKELKNNNSLDGVFVDAPLQYIAKPSAKAWGQEKHTQVTQGLYTMLDDLKNNMGDNHFILANSLRGIEATFPNMGRDLLKYIDGAMIEHFASISGASKEVIAKDIALIQETCAKGKLVVVKGWPSFNFLNLKEMKNVSQKELELRAKREIVFPLACFLVAAGEGAYFCYSWGYNDTQGGMIDYPEYNKTLGKPKGDAKKDGYIYTREFENCSVWVNISTREAMINWKN